MAAHLLRRLATVTLLAAFAAGCAGADGDVDESEEDGVTMTTEAELSTKGAVQVMQVNPFYGGDFDRPDRKSEQNGRTRGRFTTLLANRYKAVSVVAMEEVTSDASAETMRAQLAEKTGRPWRHVVFHQHSGADAKPATMEAIFFRSDKLDLVENFGTREVEEIDHGGKRESFSVRFGGALLQMKGTTRRLGVFVGKLVWLGQTRNGRALTDGDRTEEVDVLTQWINTKLAAYPRASRVVAMDMNAKYGSGPWHRMRKNFSDDEDRRPTHAWGRLDYLFWDYDSSKKRSDDGFFGKPSVSPDFGSDHRAVVANIYVNEGKK